MPSFAELIYGTAQGVPSVGEGATKSMEAGAELALRAEQLGQARAKLAQDQEQLQQVKLEKLYGYIKEANQYKNAADKKNYLNSAIGYRNAMNVDPKLVPDEAILGLASDEKMGRMFTLEMMVERRELSVADAIDLAFNPAKADKFAKLNPTAPELMGRSPDLSDAQKRMLDRLSAEKQARERLQAGDKKTDKVEERQLRSMRARLSGEFQKVNIPSLSSNLDRVDEAMGGLDTWQKGMSLPGYDGLQANIDPKKLTGPALKLRQSVRGLQNELLKMQSGTSVTEQELNNLREQLGMSPVLGENGAIKNWVFRGFSSPEAVVEGLRAVRDKMQYIEGNLAAGYPEVYDDFKTEYQKRIKATPDKRVSTSDLTLYGKSMSRQAWEQFMRDHPNDPANGAIEAMLKKQTGAK